MAGEVTEAQTGGGANGGGNEHTLVRNASEENVILSTTAGDILLQPSDPAEQTAGDVLEFSASQDKVMLHTLSVETSVPSPPSPTPLRAPQHDVPSPNTHLPGDPDFHHRQSLTERGSSRSRTSLSERMSPRSRPSIELPCLEHYPDASADRGHGNPLANSDEFPAGAKKKRKASQGPLLSDWDVSGSAGDLLLGRSVGALVSPPVSPCSINPPAITSNPPPNLPPQTTTSPSNTVGYDTTATTVTPQGNLLQGKPSSGDEPPRPPLSPVLRRSSDTGFTNDGKGREKGQVSFRKDILDRAHPHGLSQNSGFSRRSSEKSPTAGLRSGEDNATAGVESSGTSSAVINPCNDADEILTTGDSDVDLEPYIEQQGSRLRRGARSPSVRQKMHDLVARVTLQHEHSTESGFAEYVQTPYSPGELFVDKDNRCGNSRNRFYGIEDLAWYETWCHVGTTRSTYNLYENPLLVIPRKGQVRQMLIKVVDSSAFRWSVLLIIVLNAVALALDNPDTKDHEGIQGFLEVLNSVFLACFTLEMLLKVMAMGFVFHRHAYLRSTWNLLDFALLIAGFVSLHPKVANFTVVRLVRLLRPLRTISRVQGLRSLLGALFRALPHMGNVLMLLIFLITVFSALGVELWAGLWHQRCYVDLDEAMKMNTSVPEELLRRRSRDGRFSLIENYTRNCDVGSNPGSLRCGASWNGVHLPQQCHRNESQFSDGTLNFDNFAHAALLVFKIISLDDWPQDQHRTQDAAGWWVWTYFFLLTVGGSYVCMNLILAALTMVLEEERMEDRKESKELQATIQRDRVREDRKKLQRRMGSDSILNSSERVGLYSRKGVVLVDEVTGIEVRPIRCTTICFTLLRPAISFYLSAFLQPPEQHRVNSEESSPLRIESNLANILKGALQRARSRRLLRASTPLTPLSLSGRLKKSKKSSQDSLKKSTSDIDRSSTLTGVPSTVPVQSNSPLAQSTYTDHTVPAPPAINPKVEELQRLEAELMAELEEEKNTKLAPPSPTRRDLLLKKKGFGSPATIAPTAQSEPSGGSITGTSWRIGGAGSKLAVRPLSFARNRLRAFVAHMYFSRFMLVTTCFNVLVLCMDHHNIQKDMENFIEWTNFVCNIIFTIEMVLKLLAMGLSEYFSDNFNKFDFFLVLASIPEMVNRGGSAFTAFRAFRLFRLARILRVGARLLPRLRSLRQILLTILESVREASYIILILLLFIFIYTILGVQLFSEAYSPETRTNFRSLWEGALTVFVVITGEWWGKIMKEGITNTSPAAWVYFVSLFIMGNYILLNLFTSVIIFNFKDCQKDNDSSLDDAMEKAASRAAEMAVSSSLLRTKMARVLTPTYSLYHTVSPSRSDTSFRSNQSKKTFGYGGRERFRQAAYTVGKHGSITSPSRRAAGDMPFSSSTTNGSLVIRSPQNAPHTLGFDDDQSSSHDMAEIRRGTVPVIQTPELRSNTGLPYPNIPSPVTDPVSPTARGPHARTSEEVPLGPQITAGDDTELISPSSTVSQCAVTQPINSHSTLPPEPPNPPPAHLAKLSSPTHFREATSVTNGSVSDAPLDPSPLHHLALDDVPELESRKGKPSLHAFGSGWTVTESASLQRRTHPSKISLWSGDRLTPSMWVSEMVWADTNWPAEGRELGEGKKDLQGDSMELSCGAAETVLSDAKHMLQGKSLNLFPPDHPLRTALAAVIVSKKFDNFITVLILLNCVAISLSSPWWNSNRDRDLALDITDYVFVALFILEMMAKVVVYGLWDKYDDSSENPMQGDDISGHTGSRHAITPQSSSPMVAHASSFPGRHSVHLDDEDDKEEVEGEDLLNLSEEHQPYLRCAWNRIDFFVVLVGLVGLFVPEFRILRAFRSIRIIIRAESIKVVVLSLLHAIPTMWNVVAVILFIFVIFAVCGIQIFKGAMWYCTDATVLTEEECVGTFRMAEGVDWMGEVIYVEAERRWANSRVNFDHLGHAMLALFEVALGEGWAEVMYRGIDARGVGKAPVVNARPYQALYFIIFVTIGAFFAMNLFIGMLIEKFSEMTRYYNGHIFLTPSQVAWVNTVKVLHRAKPTPKPPPRPHRLLKKMQDAVQSREFDIFITSVILLNVVTMMAVHKDQDDRVTLAIEVLNLTFLCIYTAEMIAKVAAYGSRCYFRDSWNRFDSAIVVVSWIGYGFLRSPVASVFRIFRLGRVFKLINKAEGIRQMFHTLYYSLPPLMNVCMLLLVILFIYGAVGVELFGTVKLQGGLDPHTNFRNMARAAVTLFQILTAETWPDVMTACRVQPPYCEPGVDCGTDWAYPYFISFMLIGSLISLNLFITIIIDVLEHQRVQSSILAAIDSFRDYWLHFDPGGTERLGWQQLLLILRTVPKPLGPSIRYGSRSYQTRQMLRYLGDLWVPVGQSGQVRYIDCVYALARVAMSINFSEANNLTARGFTKGPEVDTTTITVRHFLAATIIQRAHRERILRRRLEMQSVPSPPDSPPTPASLPDLLPPNPPALPA